MALISEQFATAKMVVQAPEESEINPPVNPAAVKLVFLSPNDLLEKWTLLDPATAVAMGKAMVEEGERLGAIAARQVAVASPAEMAQVARQHAAVAELRRNGHHPL